jgi:hypothetical protein
MDEQSPEILAVLFNTMVKALDVGPLQETKYGFLQLAAPFSGDNFDGRDALVHGFLDDAIQFRFDGTAFVVNVMQIEREFGHGAKSLARQGLRGKE